MGPEYVGNRLDGLERPPPIILGPPDEDGTPHVLQFKEWDEFHAHIEGSE
jgi:hypothetical protein